MNPDKIIYVRLNGEKVIAKSDIMSLLKTYNCYHEGKSFQLRTREEEGELIVEGLLNISWGLKRPIRLQMHDDNERFRYACTGAWRSESSECSRNENGEQSFSYQFSLEPNNNKISGTPEPSVDVAEEDIPQLLRTRSDASFVNIQRRSKIHNSADSQRIKRNRFSINGHFYNHKTSVFTPSYGSVTNVRVNSTLTTQQVLNLLLNKFRVESKADEFDLYLVHASGEKTKLKDTEYPLVSRLLHGPCEKIARLFIMEKDLGEEITYDVAQYIKFEMPVLDSFIKKLKEEEEREILKLTRKYRALRSMILQKLDGISDGANYV
ncbi:ras association domain-containing protein 4a [Pimephales promelas]|uniref:ras association domain-containing protein 4a n=1 Tax=Pimephales promelas TaxID=90988 RepID=UPI001955C8D8|nr:ras association domain-containing protein 4a [Pimephales promelas]XP_039528154.1 ras association domain-containing protein 4a [Pimephales promelas]XP_039528155.1 ras association domain-containing protein 4a [Pimephales promelas]